MFLLQLFFFPPACFNFSNILIGFLPKNRKEQGNFMLAYDFFPFGMRTIACGSCWMLGVNHHMVRFFPATRNRSLKFAFSCLLPKKHPFLLEVFIASPCGGAACGRYYAHFTFSHYTEISFSLTRTALAMLSADFSKATVQSFMIAGADFCPRNIISFTMSQIIRVLPNVIFYKPRCWTPDSLQYLTPMQFKYITLKNAAWFSVAFPKT